MENDRVFKVSELTGNIKALLEGRFPFVRVAGEIANLVRSASGHLYFTLKDERAQLKAVLFKMQRRYLAREPQNGMEVVCLGRLSVYEPRGEYQLLADLLDFQGAGAARLAFEALKARLAAEGLFASALKRPLPFLPRHITLITSPEGAAVHDFINIAHRRFPGLHIAILPTPVQGPAAAPAMAAALDKARALLNTDVLVLCRGGGAAEDLQAYNDEALARAIRRGTIPVVSAVGHEIDFTIADFAADLRAPTPSAAAELLAPERAVLAQTIAAYRGRLQRRMARTLDSAGRRVDFAERRLEAMPHPVGRLGMRLAQLGLRLEHALTKKLEAESQRARALGERLRLQDPRLTLAQQKQGLTTLENRLTTALARLFLARQKRLAQLAAALQALSPLATLSRGYAIARKRGAPGALLRNAAEARPGDEVEIVLGRGYLECLVESCFPDGIKDPG